MHRVGLAYSAIHLMAKSFCLEPSETVINNISGVQEIPIAFFKKKNKLNFSFSFDNRNYSLLGIATQGQNNSTSIGLLQISSVNRTSRRSDSSFWTLA